MKKIFCADGRKNIEKCRKSANIIIILVMGYLGHNNTVSGQSATKSQKVESKRIPDDVLSYPTLMSKSQQPFFL